MLDQVNEVFGITADADLNILTPGQTLTQVTTRALEGLDAIVQSSRPDAILVQGDTTTTFVGALAAFYHKVPVVHLEAGLRTFDTMSPYPEEMNRRLTTQLTTLHLAATATSRANLRAENVPPEMITVTGNTVIDALLWTVSQRVDYGLARLDQLDRRSERVVVVTAHRRESWGAPMRSIGRALGRLARRNPDVIFVFPLHMNPRVRADVTPTIEGLDNVWLLEPLPYGPFARLLQRSSLILTDSGGIQEEGPSLGKPVLVMREDTERPEAIEAGTARLVGTDEADIIASVETLLNSTEAYEAMAHAVNPYGDGRAAERTAAAIKHLFGRGPRPQEFAPVSVGNTAERSVPALA